MTDLFTEQELVLISDAEEALAEGVKIKEWWELKDADNSYAEKFELVRTFNKPDYAIGFFDEILIEQKSVGIMGAVQEMLFDQVKHSSAESIRDEFREFVLHYFMRVSDYRLPEVSINSSDRPLRSLNFFLQPLSWCAQDEENKIGFGYSQLYYKLKDSGQIKKFPPHQEAAIIDLREIGTKYDWIIVKVNLFDFNLKFSPFGDTNPSLSLPLKEENYLILSNDFITQQCRSANVSDCFGFGYALIKYATDDSVLAYGPGRFSRGFQLINFYINEDGQMRARLVFVVNRPEKILSIDIDPLKWGFAFFDLMSLGLTSLLFAPLRNTISRLPFRLNDFDPITAYIMLSNFLTAGLAADEFCIELKQLEKEMLLQHFRQHYALIVGALLTWRQIPDWSDESALPNWIRTGVST